MEITKLCETLTVAERDPSHPPCGGAMPRNANISGGGLRKINPRVPSIEGRIILEPRIDGPLASDSSAACKTRAHVTVGGIDA